MKEERVCARFNLQQHQHTIKFEKLILFKPEGERTLLLLFFFLQHNSNFV